VYAVDYRIDVIANPFGAPIELGWLGLPFTPLWIAGVINALNLIDGLDGLAGGVAFISLLTVFCEAAVNGYPLMMLVSAALAGAVLAFLFFNFNPASIFHGRRTARSGARGARVGLGEGGSSRARRGAREPAARRAARPRTATPCSWRWSTLGGHSYGSRCHRPDVLGSARLP
jgi:hypothetical protein